MDEALLALITQQKLLTDAITRLMERVERISVDLGDFSERFEETMERIENERRLDLITDYN